VEEREGEEGLEEEETNMEGEEEQEIIGDVGGSGQGRAEDVDMALGDLNIGSDVDMDEDMDEENREMDFEPSHISRPDEEHEAELEAYEVEEQVEDIQGMHGMTADEEEALDEIRREEEDVAGMVLQPSILDEAFMDGFRPLEELVEELREDPLQCLIPAPLDMDRFELVITPQTYLARSSNEIATVQLVNRMPLHTLDRTYNAGPAFDTWLLLAKHTFEIWVQPRYKDGFFTSLANYQAVQPSPVVNQASTGQSVVPLNIFIHCLVQAACPVLKIKAYGQKMPIALPFHTIQNEPADVHRWDIHNWWDIGRNFNSPYIWLFNTANGRSHGVRRYPMMIPGSRDFGTVNVDLRHRRQDFTIKIYPRLVHVIKSFNSQLQGSIPKKVHGLRTQMDSASDMIHKLAGVDEWRLGGFRIEVTVKAKTLSAAAARVRETPFMDADYWVGPNARSPHPLIARLATRDDLMANANWILQKARDSNLFMGDNNVNVNKVQITALTDLFNSFGWNPDKRTPTKSLALDAWWYGVQLEEGEMVMEPEVVDTFTTLCQTDQQIRLLFTLARTQAGFLPCMLHPGDAEHRYQVNNKSPFVIRCCIRGCFHKVRRSKIIRWILDLIKNDVLDREDLLRRLEEGLQGLQEDE